MSKLRYGWLGLTLGGLTLLFFWKILLTNLILSGVDLFLYFYPYRAYVSEALQAGRLPLWNPHLFMGAPLLANSQVGLFYPPNWFFLGLTVPKQIAWSIGLHIFLAGVWMLLLARVSLRLNPLAALTAAILFAFGGYLGAQVEHINQLQAAAWLPLLFLLYDLERRSNRPWRWRLLLSLIIGLTLLAGHAQTVFISLFGLGLYGLWQALAEAPERSRRGPLAGLMAELRSSPAALRQWGLIRLGAVWRHLWPLALACLLAAALAAGQLLPTAQLSNLSIRSEGLTFEKVVSFSLRPTTLPYSLLPPFGLDLTQLWGEAFGEWVAYLGLSGLALAMLGLVRAVWHPPARRFILVAVGGLILSLGVFLGPLYLFDVTIGVDSPLVHSLARWTHPYYLLYRFVPGFGLFRAPARWLLLYAFGMAVLAGYGLDLLTQPSRLRRSLGAVGGWLGQGRWRWLLPLGPLLGLFMLLGWQRPPLITLGGWVLMTMLSSGLIYTAWRQPNAATLQKPALFIPILFIALLIGELFWAAQPLSYNQPTAPQAYHSMRNAVAFLLAADPPQAQTPPGRFLSLSGITYDPGDLADLQRVYGEHLSEKGLYNLVVATKEKEVLFFNLPLSYHLHSVDGYDGGILPLKDFITLQQLFLPADDLSLDGRLREKLRFVPANRLLSLLNTRWVITDKQFDVWIDGIFYDLQFPARLSTGQTVSTEAIPEFSATALGLVSHLENARSLPGGSPVARLTVSFVDGRQETFTLRAGRDTAEGVYASGDGPPPAHAQAAIGVNWPYQTGGVDYITRYPLANPAQIAAIEVTGLLPEGQFVLRGLSLIHQPTTTSRSVLLSTEGDYRQVHSGDVKIYENQAVLPRAFLVHQMQPVESDDAAIALLKSPDFDLRRQIVRRVEAGQPLDLQQRGQFSPEDEVKFIAYEPERVEIETNLASPGWLLLTDSYYPGWQAMVDGEPAEIFQANILFRAAPVPAGEHRVVFEFKPRSVRLGLAVSGITLGAIGLALGLLIAKKK